MLSSSCASAKHSSGITGTVNADELLFLRGPVLRKVKLFHHTRRVNLSPFAPKILLQILLTVCHTILMI